MLIKPIIDYGLETYVSAAPYYLNSRYAIQNSALRIATGAFRSSPIVILHAMTSVFPSSYSSHLKQLNLYLRLIANPTHPMHGRIIYQDDVNAATILERTPAKSFLSRVSSLHLLYQLDTSTILEWLNHPQPSVSLHGKLLVSHSVQNSSNIQRKTSHHTSSVAFFNVMLSSKPTLSASTRTILKLTECGLRI